MYTLSILEKSENMGTKAEKPSRLDHKFRGDRLRELREKMNMSQPEFEKYLGMGGMISRYERNKIEPGADTLFAIALKLQVSTDWLLGLTDNPEPDVSFKDTKPADPKTIKEAKFLDRLRKGEVLELINELSGDAIVTRNGDQKSPKNKSE